MKQKWKGKIWSILLSAAMVLGSIGVMPMTAKAENSDDEYLGYHVVLQFDNAPDASVLRIAEVGMTIAPANGSGGSGAYLNVMPSSNQGDPGAYDIAPMDYNLNDYATNGINDTSEVRITLFYYTDDWQNKYTGTYGLSINGAPVALTAGEYDAVAVYTTTMQDLIDATNGNVINIMMTFCGNGGGGGGEGGGGHPSSAGATDYLSCHQG